MNQRLPDFIIAGAPRSGTSWLYHLLKRHPAIYMAQPTRPEPKFFLVDEIYQRGIEYYAHTWFSAVGEAKVAGEKSTNYLESAIVAERIYQHLPTVKLVFILREPVDRAFSNYLWSRMNRLEKENFETALALEAPREQQVSGQLRYARPHDYFSRGLYAKLLRPYLTRFPKEQILCLRYEDLFDKPTQLTERLHLFLGVEPRPADAINLGIINAAVKPEGESIPLTIRHQLQERYAEPNRQLAQLLPDFEMWDTF